MNCEIRDKRGGHLWLNNTIVDAYLGQIGYAAFTLYAVLCRYANNDTQQCFPSQTTIATIMKCSVNTVRSCATMLAKENLVSVERGGSGCKSKCIYTLLPVIPKQADISNSAILTNELFPKQANISICEAESPSPLGDQSPSPLITNKTNTTRLTNKTKTFSRVQEKPPDPRHEVFRSDLEKCWVWMNPKLPVPQWSASDAAQLSLLLKKFPKMTRQEFRLTLRNYGTSDDVVTTRSYRRFLPKLEDYMAGPHNEFGRTRDDKQPRL